MAPLGFLGHGYRLVLDTAGAVLSVLVPVLLNDLCL